MKKFVNVGDAIAGERISASFRKIDIKGIIPKGFLGDRCLWAKLQVNVFCVVEKCLEASLVNTLKITNLHLDKGDCLLGDRVISQFGKMRRPLLTAGTSNHRIQRIVFEDKVLCRIDIAFQFVQKQ